MRRAKLIAVALVVANEVRGVLCVVALIKSGAAAGLFTVVLRSLGAH